MVIFSKLGEFWPVRKKQKNKKQNGFIAVCPFFAGKIQNSAQSPVVSLILDVPSKKFAFRDTWLRSVPAQAVSVPHKNSNENLPKSHHVISSPHPAQIWS